MRARDLPLDYNAVDILERNLPARADAVAVLSAERECTFGEVAREVNRVGNALRASGVRSGERVALLMFDSVEWVATFFGTLKIGAVAVSLNTLLTAREYVYMLRDADVRTLVIHAPLAGVLPDVLRELPELTVVVVGGADGHVAYADWIAGASHDLEAVRTHREDICSINFSSGTTGQPKGIPHAHKDYPLTAELWGKNVLGLREDDRTFAGAKLFFTFGTGGNLIFPWHVGASTVLLAGPPRVVENVLGTIDRFRPTILYNAPTGYAQMLAQEDLTTRWDLSSLRLGVSAGESLPAPLWQAFKDRTGIDIVDGIGSTENYHIFVSNRPGDIRPGSSGKPVPGYEVRLVDEDGSDVPEGEVGNLWLKGETAALSYLHQYDASRRTFRGEWLVTGDKYRRDEDGYLWHAGRADDMLKVGGIWVSPVEVESTLLSHAAVLECAVVGAEDDSGLVKPAAYVALRDGFTGSDELAETLIAHCREHAAAYKRPRWVHFVEELPKTATGKVQRFKLRGQETPR